jgi:hypothetical protein
MKKHDVKSCLKFGEGLKRLSKGMHYKPLEADVVVGKKLCCKAKRACLCSPAIPIGAGSIRGDFSMSRQ